MNYVVFSQALSNVVLHNVMSSGGGTSQFRKYMIDIVEHENKFTTQKHNTVCHYTEYRDDKQHCCIFTFHVSWSTLFGQEGPIRPFKKIDRIQLCRIYHFRV